MVGWFALSMAMGSARGECGGQPGRIVDWGLHRQWLVERDCTHPAWPARLEEIPWSERAAGNSEQGQSRTSKWGKPGGSNPEVRAGMQVMLWRCSSEARVWLTGIALGSGAEGDQVWVKAGLHGSVLRGTVRGPGLVELRGGE